MRGFDRDLRLLMGEMFSRRLVLGFLGVVMPIYLSLIGFNPIEIGVIIAVGTGVGVGVVVGVNIGVGVVPSLLPHPAIPPISISIINGINVAISFFIAPPDLAWQVCSSPRWPFLQWLRPRRIFM